MADNNKSSYSLPLLIILPLKKLVKILQKFEANFLTGILIGAIFSLVVNLITNQIGEEITKQKAQEALEIELVNQHIQATTIIDDYNRGVYKKGQVYSYTQHRFDNYIWKSLGSTTFFYSLPPDIQSKLLAHYSTRIDGTNTTYANFDNIVNDYNSKFVVCVFDNNRSCDPERLRSNDVVGFYSGWQESFASDVNKDVTEILKDFHPTKDRLEKPLLRLLMGSKGLPILTLPWKTPVPTPKPIF